MAEPAWQDNHMCFACGSKNPVGLHLEFVPVGVDGLKAEYTPSEIYQGYQGVVHGGFIGLLLDEVIANLPWKRYQQAVVTAEVNLRLHAPAPVGRKLVLTAFPDGEARGRLVLIRAEARDPEGKLYASAKAKCVKVTMA